jgi:hypothetical protein
MKSPRQSLNMYPLHLQFLNNEFNLYQLKKIQHITSSKDDARDIESYYQ